MAINLLEYVSKRREKWKPLLRQVLACKQFDLLTAIINGIGGVLPRHGANLHADVVRVAREYVKQSCNAADRLEPLLLSLVENDKLDLLRILAETMKKEVASYGVPALVRATELQDHLRHEPESISPAEDILIKAGVLNTMSTAEDKRPQLFFNMVAKDEVGQLLAFAKHLKGQIISYGGLAFLQAINEDKNKARDILFNAGAKVQPFEIDEALTYVRKDVNPKAKWLKLLKDLVVFDQTYLIRSLAEHMNTVMAEYGAAALNLAEEMGHNSVYMTLSIARLDRQHGDSKLLDFAQEMIANEELEWDDFLCQITNFGKTGLLSMIAETMTTKMIAHGSLALFHAMCKDNDEARDILVKAGTDIHDDAKKCTKKNVEHGSQHDAKDVVLSYINGDVNTARQWKSFLLKIVGLCRTDILRLIAKHKKVEMGAHGGLALLHPAQPKDLAAQAILKKAGAPLPHGNTLVHMLLAYIEDAIHDKKQWTKFLSKIVVLQQDFMQWRLMPIILY